MYVYWLERLPKGARNLYYTEATKALVNDLQLATNSSFVIFSEWKRFLFAIWKTWKWNRSFQANHLVFLFFFQGNSSNVFWPFKIFFIHENSYCRGLTNVVFCMMIRMLVNVSQSIKSLIFSTVLKNYKIVKKLILALASLAHKTDPKFYEFTQPWWLNL